METLDEVRRRLARLAWLLDNSIPIPGTRMRVGLDAIIGLIPGIGDLAGVLFSAYIVREAARAGAPQSVLMHMALNVAIEGVIGLIPFAGDVFDAAWKANQRNVALFEAHVSDPRRAARSSRVFVGFAIAGLVAIAALSSAATFLAVRAIWQAIG